MSSPYDSKTVAEVVHDYGAIRGDLSEQYARDQLVSIIEGRIEAAAASARESEAAARDAWWREKVEALIADPEWRINVALGGSDYVNDQLRALVASADGEGGA